MDREVLRVVLVDDDDGLAALLEVGFELDGRFELIGRACNGREGVEMVRDLAPDVVLMDLHMPLLGGVAATRLLIAEDPAVCVIAFTSSRDEVELEAARQAGATAVLAKPFDPVAFVETVAMYAAGCARQVDAA